MSIYEMYLLSARKKLYDVFRSKISKEKYKNLLANDIVNTVNSRATQIVKRNERYLKLLEDELKKIGKEVYSCEVVSTSRVLVNMNSPFAWLIDEVGLDWNPILDTPMIPASTIKGTISTALQFLAVEKGINYPFLRDIFLGESNDTQRISLVDITDALPIKVAENNELLERDIITPIYKEGKEGIKEHNATPTPVQFLVISPKVVFKLLVVIDKPRIEKLIEKLNREKLDKKHKKLKIAIRKYLGLKESDELVVSNFLLQLKNDLKKALTLAFETIGIGAKTSSGYGKFKVLAW